MPASKVQLIGGNFQDNEGNVLVNGTLKVRLSSDEQVAGVGQICAGVVTTLTLDANGAIDTSTPQYVWGNDQMLPVNSFYIVEGFKSDGQLAWGPNNQQVIGDGGTFDVGTWIPNVVISWTYPAAYGPTGPTGSAFVGSTGATGPTGATGAAGAGGGATFGAALPSWWGSADGSAYSNTGCPSGTQGTAIANEVKVWMIRIPYSITIQHLTYRHLSSLTTSVCAFGMYSSDGNTKLFSWDNIPTGVSTPNGTKTHALGSPVVLSAGLYFVASACDTTGLSPTTLGGYVAGSTNEGVLPWNTNGTVRDGVAGNAMSGGALPATLGTISPGGGGWGFLPLFVMEP